MLTIIELGEDVKSLERMTVIKDISSVQSYKDYLTITASNGKTYIYDICLDLTELTMMQGAMNGASIGIVICKGREENFYMDNMSGWSNAGFVKRAREVLLDNDADA